ncbi:MAG: dockerin type I repeat-containing protein [Ruminococcus sp.]|nr:dockerin type I repeat-containing protein [Ruminococcus sp.]
MGDANGDGYVTVSDSICIYQYLKGAYLPNSDNPAENITAMDINQDYVIDWSDYDDIEWLDSIGGTPSTVSKELYEVPANEPRDYIKYNYSTGVRTPYSLSAVPTPSLTVADTSELLYEPVRASDDYFDFDNKNRGVVLIKSNGNVIGSGFLVNEHVIATSANTVYGYGADSFETDVTVDIFYSNSSTYSSNLKTTVTPTYVHIPSDYINTSGNGRHNYNYALLYFPENLTLHSGYSSLKQEYGFFDFGCAVSSFDQSAENVTTSGYRFSEETGVLSRYLDKGTVVNFGASDSGNLREYRLKTLGHCDYDQFGGVMYYENPGNVYKGAIAVTTGFGGGNTSWGTRINPTLIKFYLQNNNL